MDAVDARVAIVRVADHLVILKSNFGYDAFGVKGAAGYEWVPISPCCRAPINEGFSAEKPPFCMACASILDLAYSSTAERRSKVAYDPIAKLTPLVFDPLEAIVVASQLHAVILELFGAPQGREQTLSRFKANAILYLESYVEQAASVELRHLFEAKVDSLYVSLDTSVNVD